MEIERSGFTNIVSSYATSEQVGKTSTKEQVIYQEAMQQNNTNQKKEAENSSKLNTLFANDMDSEEVEEKVKKAIETANKKIVGPNIELNFSIHEKTNRIMIQVKNQETGETIREIPSEKVLDMLANMWDLSGKVIDLKK